MNTSSRITSMFGVMLALCGLFFLAPRTQAQSAASTASAASPAQLPVPYDLSKETRIQGSIQQVDTSNDRAPIGAHILVQTASGVVDAHLGPLNQASLDALHLSAGEAVTLTGMNESISSGAVFLVRILTTSSRVVILRNEHGYPVRSLVRRGSSSSTLLKGAL